MQTTLLTSYRSFKKHPSRLKLVRTWVYVDGSPNKLTAHGLWGKDDLLQGVSLERVTLLLLGRQITSRNVIPLIKLQNGLIERANTHNIQLGLVFSDFQSSWSIRLKLSVNHATPAEGRVLNGVLDVQPLLEGLSSSDCYWAWKKNFETPLYDGLEINDQGLFCTNLVMFTEGIDGWVTRCRSKGYAAEDALTMRLIIQSLQQDLNEALLNTANSGMYNLLDGESQQMLIQIPDETKLKWMREDYQRLRAVGANTSLLECEIIELLRERHAIVKAIIHLLISPFLHSAWTANKELADPILKFESQLEMLISSGSGPSFETQFLGLDCIGWSQLINWAIITNPDFFRSEFERILGTQESVTGTHLEQSIPAETQIDPTIMNLVTAEFRNIIRSQVSKDID